MFNYHITPISSNKKTGPIPVTTTSRNSCPDTCQFKGNGCYAESGPLLIHWRKVSEGTRGIDETEFFRLVKGFRKGQLWRHNQAGDLPHINGKINSQFVSKLVKANKGKLGFTYTHHELSQDNLYTISAANSGGFTVNISANNTSEAVSIFRQHGLPTVTVLPIDAPNSQTIDGIQVVACPAEKSDKISCANCALCQVADRSYIIGFRAHGTGKKKANKIAMIEAA